MDAEQSLLELVSNRLAADGVPSNVADLIRAAYTGIDELNAALAGGGAPHATEKQHTSRTDPLYLAAITVTGFRGVGPRASLQVAPHPGLTLVVGRNGSGKSSFAEAAELARHLEAPQSFRPRLGAQFLQQMLADMLALAEAARILFQRQDMRLQEGVDAAAKIMRFGGKRKIHVRSHRLELRWPPSTVMTLPVM